MKYNQEIRRAKSSERYESALHIIRLILTKGTASRSSLIKLYGNENVDHYISDINNFSEKNFKPSLKIRTHQLKVPTDIGDQKLSLENNKHFSKIQSALINSESPDMNDLGALYGKYAPYIFKSFRAFLDRGLLRKCGIPMPTHHNRVGALVHSLKFDQEGANEFAAAGALHDTIEDLLNKQRDKYDIHFGLMRYDEFLVEYIPEAIQERVKMLTNHYDLILSYIAKMLDSVGKTLNNESLMHSLESLAKDQRLKANLLVYIEKMIEQLKDFKPEKDFFNEAKWVCYRDLYIQTLAQNARNTNDHNAFRLKAIDLSDNAHGSKSLDMSGRNKNIIKMALWAKEGFLLHKGDWKSVNNFVQELFDEALTYSEYLVINDLLEVYSTQDFLHSALRKIKILEGVFYTDR